MKRFGSIIAIVLLLSGVHLDAHSQRESITFIMGEDRQANNPYYAHAEAFYRYEPSAMTNHLITYARSLYDIREHLDCHSPENGEPWGLVNVVVHSNEWTGMETAVIPQGQRVQKYVLDHYVRNGDFLPLENSIIDSKTEIVIHGCALGKDVPLLESISFAFGGDDLEKPVIRSSKYFVFYETDLTVESGDKYRRYLAEFRYGHHPSFYRPKLEELAMQFRKAYPSDTLDWEGLLDRESPRYTGDFYEHSFRVPVTWLVTYEDSSSLPNLDKYRDQQAWLDLQPELMAAVKKLGMQKNDFMWTFKQDSYTFEDGITEPAIKAIGLCTIVCALRVLTDPNSNQVALKVDPKDSRYYSKAGGGT